MTCLNINREVTVSCGKLFHTLIALAKMKIEGHSDELEEPCKHRGCSFDCRYLPWWVEGDTHLGNTQVRFITIQ